MPTGATFEFGLLGPVTVKASGRERSVPGAKQRTLLAALLLAGGAPIRDARLTTLLWGDDPPATVGAQLYTYASRLRCGLGPGLGLVRQAGGYGLDPAGTHSDVGEFRLAAGEGHDALRSGRYAFAADRFAAALGRWRGPALADVTEHLRHAEAPALHEARMAALQGRIQADLALGDHARLVPELTVLVRRHPLREHLRALLMTALHHSGRRAAALACFAEGQRVLASELDVGPGDTLLAARQAALHSGDVSGPDGLERLPGARELRTWDRAMTSPARR